MTIIRILLGVNALGIGRYRPLFISCCCAMASVVLGIFTSDSPFGRYVQYAGILTAFLTVCVCVFLRVGARSKPLRTSPSKYPITVLLLASLAAFSGFVSSHVYAVTTVTPVTVSPVQISQSEPTVLSGTVTETSGNQYNYLATLDVKTVNGKRLPGIYRCKVYLCSEESVPFSYHVNDCITVVGRAVGLDELTGSGQESAYLKASGLTLGLVLDSADSITSAETSRSPGFSETVNRWRYKLSALLNLTVGKQGSGLPSAILLGDRQYLSLKLKRDFSRSGVSHLLAVSGMHVTILLGFFTLLFKCCRIPRKIRCILLVLLSFGFVTLTGFSLSAIRATVMVNFIYIASLLSVDSDALTSLGVAGALILLFSPLSVYDVGFWMSFFATFGLIVMPSIRLSLKPKTGNSAGRKKSARKSVLLQVSKALSSSVSTVVAGFVALGFTSWILSLNNGSVSLFSPLSTLLITPFCSAVLILSLFALPLCRTYFGLKVLAPMIRLLCVTVGKIAAGTGYPECSLISLKYPLTVPILIVTSALLIVILFLPLGKKYRALVWIPPLFCVLYIAVSPLLPGLMPSSSRGNDVFCVPVTSRGDAFVTVCHDKTYGVSASVIDISGGSQTSLYQATELIHDHYGTEIQALVLTTYSSGLPASLERTLSSQTVRKLIFYTPLTEKDYYVFSACVEIADDYGIPLAVYTPDLSIRLPGELNVSINKYPSVAIKSTVPVITVQVTDGVSTLSYLGRSYGEVISPDTVSSLFESADFVVLGHYGPVSHEPYPVYGLSGIRVLTLTHPETAAWLSDETLADLQSIKVTVGKTVYPFRRQSELEKNTVSPPS